MELREKYGNERVVASDIREGGDTLMGSGPFELLDATMVHFAYHFASVFDAPGFKNEAQNASPSSTSQNP